MIVIVNNCNIVVYTNYKDNKHAQLRVIHTMKLQLNTANFSDYNWEEKKKGNGDYL